MIPAVGREAGGTKRPLGFFLARTTGNITVMSGSITFRKTVARGSKLNC